MLPELAAEVLIADKAFDAEEQGVRRRGARAEAARAGRQDRRDPAQGDRRNARPYDRDLYKARHLIENFFAKLKQYRAIATRYDKRATHFLGAVHLAATIIWLNRGQALAQHPARS